MWSIFEGTRIIAPNDPTATVVPVRYGPGQWVCSCGCGYRVKDFDVIADLEEEYELCPLLVVVDFSDTVVEAA